MLNLSIYVKQAMNIWFISMSTRPGVRYSIDRVTGYAREECNNVGIQSSFVSWNVKTSKEQLLARVIALEDFVYRLD